MSAASHAYCFARFSLSVASTLLITLDRRILHAVYLPV
jgi:hypothetical protein